MYFIYLKSFSYKNVIQKSSQKEITARFTKIKRSSRRVAVYLIFFTRRN